MKFSYITVVIGMIVLTFLPIILTRGMSQKDYGLFSLFYPGTKLAILLFDLALTQYITVKLSDKTGIVDFAKSLQELGWRIISTGGTHKLLEEKI